MPDNDLPDAPTPRTLRRIAGAPELVSEARSVALSGASAAQRKRKAPAKARLRPGRPAAAHRVVFRDHHRRDPALRSRLSRGLRQPGAGTRHRAVARAVHRPPAGGGDRLCRVRAAVGGQPHRRARNARLALVQVRLPASDRPQAVRRAHDGRGRRQRQRGAGQPRDRGAARRHRAARGAAQFACSR